MPSTTPSIGPRALSVLAVSLATALLLAACGSDAAQSATPTATAPDAEPTTSVGDTPEVAPTAAPSADGGASEATCTSDPAPVFTHHYTDLDQIDFINPTIVTSGNWLKNRQYHKVVTDADNEAPEVPIYAPIGAVATGITYYLGQMTSWSGESFELPQYDLRFQVSCEVSFGFDHLSRLAEPFASLAPSDPVRDTRNAEQPLTVEVEAGQLIGWSSGTAPARTWDFIVTNTTTTNSFVNQPRYEASGDLRRLLHAACPTDYLAPDLADAFTSKLGWWQGVSPDAGCNLSPDVPGALAGGWFRSPFDGSPNAPVEWGLVATVAADGYLDLNGPGTALRVSPDDPSFLDPAEMTGEHCYAHYQGGRWAYVRITSDGALAAAFGDGSCPASLPDDHQLFYR